MRFFAALALLSLAACPAVPPCDQSPCPSGYVCGPALYCIPIPAPAVATPGAGATTDGGSGGDAATPTGGGGPSLVPIAVGPGGLVSALGELPDQQVTLLGQISGSGTSGQLSQAGLFASVSGGPWTELSDAAANLGDAGTYLGSGLFYADPGPQGAWYAGTVMLQGGREYGGFSVSVDQGQHWSLVAPSLPVTGAPALARASTPSGGTRLFIGTSAAPGGLAELPVGADAGYRPASFWDGGVPSSLAASPDGTELYAISGDGSFVRVDLATGSSSSAQMPCSLPGGATALDVVPGDGGPQIFGITVTSGGGAIAYDLSADGGPAPLFAFDPPAFGPGAGSLSHLGGYEYLAHGSEIAAFPLSAIPIPNGPTECALPNPSVQTPLLDILALAPRGPSMVAGTLTGVFDVTEAAVYQGAVGGLPTFVPDSANDGFDGVFLGSYAPGAAHLFAAGSDGRVYESLVAGSFTPLPRLPSLGLLASGQPLAVASDHDLVAGEPDGTLWRWQGAGWSQLPALASGQDGGPSSLGLVALPETDGGLSGYDALLPAPGGGSVYAFADGGWIPTNGLDAGIALLVGLPPYTGARVLYAFGTRGEVYASHDGLSFAPLATSLAAAPIAAAIGPDGGFAAITATDAGISVFTGGALERAACGSTAEPDDVEALAYAPSGTLFVVGHDGLYQIDASTAPPTCALLASPNAGDPLEAIGFSPDGALYATGLVHAYQYR